MPSAADWNELHADPLQGDVATAQSTTSTTYTDLATSGPSVTKSLVAGQKVLVLISAQMSHSAGGGAAAAMSFAVSGASTLAAADTNRCTSSSTSEITTSRSTVFTATATGSHTFTVKYRVVSSGTGTFTDRRIIVKTF